MYAKIIILKMNFGFFFFFFSFLPTSDIFNNPKINSRQKYDDNSSENSVKNDVQK